MTRPIIKWVGGKTQLLPELLRIIPPTSGTYYEPFIGGAAVFLASHESKRFSRAVINDVNPELTNLYQVVRDQPDDLMSKLDVITSTADWNTQEYFTLMRSMSFQDPADRAARFIYLNKTCFNGLYRVNRSGKFNVPFGRYKNPKLYDRATLMACSEALQGVEIRTGDFSDATRDAQPGDVVYLDPPYVPVSKTSSFTAYSGDFGPKEQASLAEWVKHLVLRGVTCVLSNSDTPLVHELYGDFELHTVGARRSVNSDGTKRGKINEIVVVGIPEGFQPVVINQDSQNID